MKPTVETEHAKICLTSFPFRMAWNKEMTYHHCFSTSLWNMPSEGSTKNQDWLKLNGTNQLLAYADDINILGENTDTIQKNKEGLLDATKEVGLEVNPEKTKYMLMSCCRTAGQKHSIKIANRSFQGVAKFKYLGTSLTDQNCMNEEIKSRLNAGNACYHSVQSLLSSRLLSRNVRLKYTKP
jgi:hypothetical protein